jgi:D-alanyl-D-alanine carboxypeptidase
LSASNISTPFDIARLAAEAFSKSEIQEPSMMAEHYQVTVDTHVRTRVATTNRLLFDRDLVITGGKTGYTDEAGYCLVVKSRVPNSNREVIAVVLGSSTENARFDEVKKLLQWTFAHHAWPE